MNFNLIKSSSIVLKTNSVKNSLNKATNTNYKETLKYI